jgi:hypothetical protein
MRLATVGARHPTVSDQEAAYVDALLMIAADNARRGTRSERLADAQSTIVRRYGRLERARWVVPS